jgi:hypothetical protein
MTLHQLLVLCVINGDAIDNVLYERSVVFFDIRAVVHAGLILQLHQIERKRRTPDTSSHVIAEVKKENFFSLSRYLVFTTLNAFMAAME